MDLVAWRCGYVGFEDGESSPEARQHLLRRSLTIDFAGIVRDSVTVSQIDTQPSLWRALESAKSLGAMSDGGLGFESKGARQGTRLLTGLRYGNLRCGVLVRARSPVRGWCSL